MAYTTIDDPELYFQVKLYTGNGSAGHSMTFDGTNDMQPDVVWIKTRSNSSNHQIHNSLTSETYHYLRPNATTAEITSNSDALTSFDSDGFTIGSDGVINESGYTYVAWCWKESADAGFDIVGYNGTGNDATANISHSLSAVPEFMWIKCRTSAKNNTNYHVSLGNTKSIYIDETNAASTSYDYWADTTPTSSVFTVKDDGSYDEVNAASDQTFIAYLWSGKQGFSKFSSFTGNGNADGAYVHLGFRPAWVLIRRTDSAENWFVFDNKRDTFNPEDTFLRPNLTNADADESGGALDFLSNGFKIRNSGDSFNNSSGTYIYMAFAEQPFVNSKGVPCNAR